MALSASTIIGLRAPQCSADPRLGDMLTLAAQMTSACAFGDNYQLALALRVLHWLTMEARNGGTPGVNGGSGSAGAITSETEGQLSRSYGGVSSSSVNAEKYPDLIGTQYGTELIALIRGSIIGPRNQTMTECDA